MFSFLRTSPIRAQYKNDSFKFLIPRAEEETSGLRARPIFDRACHIDGCSRKVFTGGVPSGRTSSFTLYY
jgi:hypothetical protein